MEQTIKPTQSTQPTQRRRVPRRDFLAPVGVLLHGQYSMERSFQVGEGGMMISSQTPIEVGTLVVCTFYLSTEMPIIVRGAVRSVAQDEPQVRYGVEFINLGFQYKRAIRTFVAAGSRTGSF
jgi:hypothetical protein